MNACKTLRACPQLQAAYAKSLQDLGGFLLGKEALEARASSNPALSSFMVFLDEGHGAGAGLQVFWHDPNYVRLYLHAPHAPCDAVHPNTHSLPAAPNAAAVLYRTNYK